MILAENNSTQREPACQPASRKKLFIGKENENNETKRPKWKENKGDDYHDGGGDNEDRNHADNYMHEIVLVWE